MNFKKKIIANRAGYKPVEMNIEIKGNEIHTEVDQELMFIDFSRYLLESTPILENQKKRINPYKLRVEKHRDNLGSFSHRSYHVDYLEINNGQLSEKSTHVLNLYTTNMKIKGRFTCYIPDLLLVFEERGYVQKQKDETFIKSRKFNTDVTYSEPLLTVHELESKGYIVPLSYKSKVNIPETKEIIVKNPYKALVIAVADCSASMGTWEKSVAKEYYDLALQSIKEKYISIEEVFIAHSTEADFATKKELFTASKSGGTIVSSMFEKLQEKLETDREIIILQFSDGDNLTSDNARVVKRLTENVLPNVKYFKYIESNQYNRHSTLLHVYKNINEKNFSYLQIKTADDALKGLRLRNEIETL